MSTRLSTRLIQWAMEQTDLPGPAKCVLLVLAIRAKKTNHPSLSEIAVDTGFNRRTVVRSLQILNDMQKIRRDIHGGRPTIYTLTSDTQSLVTHAGTSDRESPSTSDSVTLVKKSLVTQSHQFSRKKKKVTKEKERVPLIIHYSNLGHSTARQARPTKVPVDFAVNDNMREWAYQQGFDDHTIQEQTLSMIDHFLGSGKPKLDWVATWRNWLRNSRGRFNGNGQRSNSDTTLENIQKLSARLDRQDRVRSEREARRGHSGGVPRTADLPFARTPGDSDEPHD